MRQILIGSDCNEKIWHFPLNSFSLLVLIFIRFQCLDKSIIIRGISLECCQLICDCVNCIGQIRSLMEHVELRGYLAVSVKLAQVCVCIIASKRFSTLPWQNLRGQKLRDHLHFCLSCQSILNPLVQCFSHLQQHHRLRQGLDTHTLVAHSLQGEGPWMECHLHLVSWCQSLRLVQMPLASGNQ